MGIPQEKMFMGKIKSVDKRVCEIKCYIKKNYDDSALTMENIAHSLGINPRYMLKIFKEETGYLLKEYLLDIRITHAKELLKMGLTVEAVSKKCGYTTSHSFIRAFKKACGITPGEMRKVNKYEEQ